MTSAVRKGEAVDLDLLVEQLTEAQEYLYQIMTQKPHDNTLDLPYALIGEAIDTARREMPDEG